MSTSSVIDLFITNAYADVDVAGTITCNISDCIPIFMAYYSKFMIFPYNHYHHRKAIIEMDRSVMYRKYSVNDSYNLFLQKFRSHYEINFPRKAMTSKKKIQKPWSSALKNN